MGLDMFLCGRKTPRSEPKRTEDGFEVTEVTIELGYWRKHPDLHGYIVQTFAGGVDECQKINLSTDDMRDIIHAINAGELPHTQGFFFGESENTPDERAADVATFERAIAWLDAAPHDEWRDVYYQASW